MTRRLANGTRLPRPAVAAGLVMSFAACQANDDAFYEMQQIKNGSRGSCNSGSTYSDGCGATYSCSSGNGNGEFSGPCCL